MIIYNNILEFMLKKNALDNVNESMQVTYLTNEGLTGTSKHRKWMSKLNGKFELLINNNLSIKKKYEQYALEPLVYHLYKKRMFFHKLMTSKHILTILVC